MNWIEQGPHVNARDAKRIHILVHNDEYVAFVSKESDGYRALVPNLTVLPRGQSNIPTGHYTHDTLQEAKDWCVVELVKRRLET